MGSKKDGGALIISIEAPHFGVHEVLSFTVRLEQDGDSLIVTERLAELVQEAVSDLSGQLIHTDHRDPAAELARARTAAQAGLAEWKARLRTAEEDRLKAENAKQQLNTMRESYHKEITQLREQLHLQRKANQEGRLYQADDIDLFDPTEYAFDDEAGRLLKAKAEELKRRYNEHRSRFKDELDSLTHKVESLNFVLARKDILLHGLMKHFGVNNEAMLEQQLEAKKMNATPSRTAKRKTTTEKIRAAADRMLGNIGRRARAKMATA